MRFCNQYPILFVVMMLFFINGCTGSKEVATEPGFSQQEYDTLISEGDDSFSKMHLYAWRKADESYQKAYDMKRTPQLRDKRYLTLCLTALREKDEQIINPITYEKIAQLGTFPKTGYLKYFPDLIRHYRTAPIVRNRRKKLRSDAKKDVDISLFNIENSAMDAYLYFYFLKYYTFDFGKYSEELNALYKKHNLSAVIKKYTTSLSPLFVFSNNEEFHRNFEAIIEKYPQYTEGLAKRGSRLFMNKKLKKAARLFGKTLELIPNYNAALIGMGNIYYYTVQNMEKALVYYQKALDTDALNPVALFGKSVALHNLERYEESDLVLDTMLEKQDEFHGQAYYYKGYNRHLCNEPMAARKFVLQAQKRLPRSGEVNFLSGLLYFNQSRMKKAIEDFDTALWDREYSQCLPLYYMSLARMKLNDWWFLDLMAEAITCLEHRLLKLEKSIGDVDDLSLGSLEKEWMKKDRRKKYEAFKLASTKMIAQLEALIAANIPKKKARDRQVKNKAINKIVAALKKDPLYINKKDSSGSTPLHTACEQGLVDVVKYLVKRGGRLEITNKEGYTPMHWAILLQKTRIVKFLLESGAKVSPNSIPGSPGYTPLHDAAYNGNKEIVKILLDAGADPYCKTQNGKIPLDLAKEHMKTGVLDLLKPLHIAAEQGDILSVNSILKKNPEMLNSLDEYGRSPLYLASVNGFEQVVEHLLEYGPDVNIREVNGYAALEKAREKGHVEIARMLAAKGARAGDREMLERQLQEGEAAVWRLASHGCAIKTRSYFLIFGYSAWDAPNFLSKKTEERLSNGCVNPLQLKGQKVYLFFPGVFGDRGAPDIAKWKKTLPDMRCILGDNITNVLGEVMDSRQSRIIDGMEITTIDAVGGGVGFLVKVDGLTIYYGGGHRNWSKKSWGDYSKEIDFLAEKNTTVDLAFMPLAGELSKTRDSMDKGLLYALELLHVKCLFPLAYGVGSDSAFRGMNVDTIRAFSRKVKGKSLGTSIHNHKYCGDRIVFKKGAITRE
ncbi:MAG: hypothetical protein GY757_22935 [bacterium]|nr:hypothetical protein [bacterium]